MTTGSRISHLQLWPVQQVLNRKQSGRGWILFQREQVQPQLRNAKEDAHKLLHQHPDYRLPVFLQGAQHKQHREQQHSVQLRAVLLCMQQVRSTYDACLG